MNRSKFWLHVAFVLFAGMVASYGMLLTQATDDNPIVVAISGFGILVCGLGAMHSTRWAVEAKKREHHE